MNKKFLIVLVCMGVIFGICGCQKNNDSSATKDKQEEKVKVKKLTEDDDLLSFVKKLSNKTYYKPEVTSSSKSKDYSSNVESHLLYIDDEYIYDITVNSDNKNTKFEDLLDEEKEKNKYKISELKLESDNEEVYLKAINNDNKELILGYPYCSDDFNYLHIQKTWAQTSYTNYDYHYDYDEAMEIAKSTAKSYNNSNTTIPAVNMTSYEVVNSEWGEPNKEIKKTFSWGTVEKWKYNKYGSIYFLNGKVTSISER